MAAKTMKIKLLVSVAGEWGGSVGDIRERPEDEALRFIAAEFAVAVEKPKREKPKREKATRETRETATAEE